MTKLTVTTTVHAPLATIRDARNNPNHIINRCFASEDWCCPKSSNDLKVGGLMNTRMEAKDGSFGFDMTAQYTIVEPMQKISYTMGSYERDADVVDAGRVVDISFEELSHDVLIIETFDAEDIHDLTMQQAGRQAILDNFKKYVESL